MTNTFAEFFSSSFSDKRHPYPYQSRLAGADSEPCHKICESRLIVVPTGLGKTAGAILSWLWNRVHCQSESWPRRLVYCLPMRTLAEQTYKEAEAWLNTHKLLWDGEINTHAKKVGLHLLMGGESTVKWEQYPEADCILIGTQDMLLSRALNRGYGMSRFRWPMHYGLLNSDCLWVFDEVQLMGAGLTTTAQLTAFRDDFGSAKSSKTWWMSATSSPEWLNTVDFKVSSLAPTIILEKNSDLKNEAVIRLKESRKTLQFCENSSTNIPKLASEIVTKTSDRQGLTLVVVNTVKKARELHAKLTKQLAGSTKQEAPLLLHSQFRPDDRDKILTCLLSAEKKSIIAISTQIIEAGVDISANTLFTEMAPWSSLVQRFGRCNRRGTEHDSKIYIVPADKALPYEEDQLIEAKRIVDELIASEKGASPNNLSEIPIPACDKPVSKHVIRKRDFIDLFDTTPDLAGNDIDIERWVRDADDSKVSLFWRTWEGSAKDQTPPKGSDFPAPHRSELCPAPIGETRDWVDKANLPLRRWDHLTSSWEKVPKEFGKSSLVPGHIYLLPVKAGGYSPTTGFDPKSKAPVEPVLVETSQTNDATSRDLSSEGTWQSIAVHTGHVVSELTEIMQLLDINLEALLHAARWHDLGKAHSAFQAKIDTTQAATPEALPHQPHAKAPKSAWLKSFKEIKGYRKYFRHELASALAILQPAVTSIPEDSKNLVAWLIAAHHGKIRLSIRSLPEETLPKTAAARYARGVHDDDLLDEVDLGNGVISPKLNLSLEPMELGLCIEPPFEGEPSWTERMLALRDAQDIGPLRLAYWETLLRAADERASANHP